MKNLLSMAAVAGIVATFAAPAAHADEFVARYTYLVNGSQIVAPAVSTTTVAPSTTMVLEQPAVIEKELCAPAVVTTTAKPIMVEHHENLNPHIFHLGVWPLVDFSIF